MALVAATRSIGQHYSEMTAPEIAFSRLGFYMRKTMSRSTSKLLVGFVSHTYAFGTIEFKIY